MYVQLCLRLCVYSLMHRVDCSLFAPPEVLSPLHSISPVQPPVPQGSA